jgi:hypothetical protein
MPEQNSAIIDALVANEKKLSKLYQTYATTYREYQDFWFILASEELEHASWIRDLEESYRRGTLWVNDNFHIEAVKLFGGFLEERLVDAEVESFSMERALTVALDIENSLIDRGWFKMFESAQAKDKATIEQLITAIEIHKESVTKMIAEYRSK